MCEGAWWGGAELCTVHSLLNPPTCVPDSPTPLSTLTPPSSPTGPGGPWGRGAPCGGRGRRCRPATGRGEGGRTGRGGAVVPLCHCDKLHNLLVQGERHMLNSPSFPPSSGNLLPPQVRQERDTLQNSRKEAWVRDAELRKRVETLQADLRSRKGVRRRGEGRREGAGGGEGKPGMPSSRPRLHGVMVSESAPPPSPPCRTSAATWLPTSHAGWRDSTAWSRSTVSSGCTAGWWTSLTARRSSTRRWRSRQVWTQVWGLEAAL